MLIYKYNNFVSAPIDIDLNIKNRIEVYSLLNHFNEQVETKNVIAARIFKLFEIHFYKKG